MKRLKKLRKNPYIAGKPVVGPDFFGRKELIGWVDTELENPETGILVVYGQRRVGKTSLLLQLKRSLSVERYVSIYCDLMDKAELPLGEILVDLAAEIAREVGLLAPSIAADAEKASYFCDIFLPEVFSVTGVDKRIVFLFDEFEVVDREAELKLSGNVSVRSLHPFLRQLSQTDSRVALVFAMGRKEGGLSADARATFRSSLTHDIWVLDNESASALVRHGEADGVVQFTPEAVARILELTNNHPYFTQLLCQRAWQRARDLATAPPQNFDDDERTFSTVAVSVDYDTASIGVVDVEDAVDVALRMGYNALVWIWEGLTLSERICASAAAQIMPEGGSASLERLSDEIASYLSGYLGSGLVRAAGSLSKRWILVEEEGGDYRFAVEFFRRWVSLNMPLSDFRSDLYALERGNTGNLLWVDDDSEGRFFYEVEDFQRMGWRVTWTHDVLSAAMLLSSQKFDAVFLDQMLPVRLRQDTLTVWGGCLLLAWIRRVSLPGNLPYIEGQEVIEDLAPQPENVGIPVRFVSAYQDPEVLDVAVSAIDPTGNIEVTHKPLEVSALRRFLGEVRAGRK